MIFFTIAPDSKGGGGRRVFTGILNGLISLGHAVFVVSEKKYPMSLRGEEQDTCEYFNLNDALEETLFPRDSELVFRNYINKKKIDAILCDTEYSLSNFFNCLPKFCEKSPVQIYTLCHDQIWRDYMRLYGNFYDDRMFHPYHRYSKYLRRDLLQIRSGWQKAMENMPRASRITGKDLLKNHIRRIFPKLVELVSEFKAYTRFRKAHEKIALTAGVVSLTERSARETEHLYQLRSGQSIACFGYIDGQLRSFKSRCDSQLVNSKKIIAFCRLGPEKNLDLVIFSFIEALKIKSDLKLTITGRNDSISTSENVMYLKFLIEGLGCGDRIRLIENPSDENLITEIGTSNVMICAQNCDFNLTIYEGLYLGKQVVVPETYDFPAELADSKNIHNGNIRREDFTSSLLKASNSSYTYDAKEREFLSALTYDRYANSLSDFITQNISQPKK